MAKTPSREQSIELAISVLDDPIFKALQEPSRVAVLKRVMVLGKADVGEIAEGLPLERSVVSRHLKLLTDAGILCQERAGRHRLYRVQGSVLQSRFEAILVQIRNLNQLCCPDKAGKCC